MENEYKNTSLGDSLHFWISIFVPITIGFLFALWTYATQKIECHCELIKLQGILEIYQLPIGIASIFIPWTALVVYIHRSTQTKHQIDLSQRQIELQIENNRISNFFKHRESFHELLTKLSSIHKDIEFTDMNKTYRLLFPSNRSDHFSAKSHSSDNETSELVAMKNSVMENYNFIQKAIPTQAHFRTIERIQTREIKERFLHTTLIYGDLNIEIKDTDSDISFEYRPATNGESLFGYLANKEEPTKDFNVLIDIINRLSYF